MADSSTVSVTLDAYAHAIDRGQRAAAATMLSI